MEEQGQAVIVQVCGRRETVSVEQVTARALAVAVEQRFEVRPPFLFADQQGRMLPDDQAIASYVKFGDPLVVRLTEGVLHDFGRRVDQIRHLQWGFLADQLATGKQDRSEQKADLQRWRLAAEQEQAARQAADTDLQRGIDALEELLLRERETRGAVQLEAEARTSEVQAKLRQAVDSMQGSLRKEREDFRTLLHAESGARDDATTRLRKDLADLRDALALEESQRKAADDTLLTTLQQAQTFTCRDQEGRLVEMKGLANSVRDLQAAVTEVKAEISRAHASIGHRAQEEDQFRKQGANEVFRQMDELRRSLDVEAKERELLDDSVKRIGQELARKSSEDEQVRQADMERLSRIMSEESDKRQESFRRVSASVAAAEQTTDRVQHLRELEHAILECREVVRAEQEERAAMLDELGQKSELCQASVARLREDCKEAMQREVRSRVDREQSMREELELRFGEIRGEVDMLAGQLYREDSHYREDLHSYSSKDHHATHSARIVAGGPFSPSLSENGGSRQSSSRWPA